MTTTFTAACIQNEGLADMAASVAAATELVRAARGSGAELICLPEYFACYKAAETEFIVGPQAEPVHPALAHFRGLAEELPLDKLDAMTSEAVLSDLPDLAKQILKGQVRGRLVVDVNG